MRAERLRRLILLAGALVVVAAAGALYAPLARGSQLIDRDATDISLAVDAKGEALLTYTVHGRVRHVLVWGAINARTPSATTPQVKFDVDYSGGWAKYHSARYWRTFVNACRPYTGPALAYVVAACEAPDGSYWALQSWHVALPDLGFVPWTSALAASWLEVSHWKGPLARLQVYSDWVYPQHFHRLFGRASYAGKPVYGFSATSHGAPLDGYGRLIYVDSFDAPAYGPGWHRDNSFLTHSPAGVWCYGFYPENPLANGYSAPPGYDGGLRGPGVGTLYRVSMLGPGVTPDVAVTIRDPGTFNPANAAQVSHQAEMRNQLLALGSDAACDAH